MTTKGFTDELKATAAQEALGVAASELLDSQIDKIAKTTNLPMRMHAAATPDAKLYFEASVVKTGNGVSKLKPPIGDKIPVVAASTLNLTTAATTGGTFQVDGGTLAIPVGTIGNAIRLVAALRSTGEINLKFSAQAATVAALDAVETMVSGLDGEFIGYADLQYATTTALKTAGSATTIIENEVSGTSRIFNVAGGGGSGGGDRTYKITSITATQATIKGGYERIRGFGTLSSGTGATVLTAAADQTVTLATILTNSGLSFVANRLYALVIDMYTLATTPTTLDNLRQVFTWDVSNLKLLVSVPDATINPRRYVILDEISVPTGAANWSTATAIPKPAREHDFMYSFDSPAQLKTITTQGVSTQQTVSHGLSGKPQDITVWYYDGTNERPVDAEAHVFSISATQIVIDPAGRDLTAPKFLRTELIYLPGAQQNLASPMDTQTFGPYTATTAATLAHGFNSPGHQVMFWAVEEIIATGTLREMPVGSIVQGWDAANINVDWTGIPFTDALSRPLRYWLKAGPQPRVASFPLEFGGYTKLVGRGPGSYTGLVAALAVSTAGDRILVMRDTIETADITIPAGVEVVQMPGTTVAINGTFGVVFSGVKAAWKGMNLQLNPVGAVTIAILISAADCWVDGHVELATARTVTNLISVSPGLRAHIDVGSKATLGTITNSGGLKNPMTLLGDSVYGDVVGLPAALAGNTTTTKKWLSQTGNGTTSAAPSWLPLDEAPPVGSIVAYVPGYFTAGANAGFTRVGPSANTAAAVNTFLPNNWRVCDGTTLNDAASPIFNAASRFLPNLTDSRFLLGSAAAGTAAGSNTVTLSTTELPAHSHTQQGTFASGNNSVGHSHTQQGSFASGNQSADHTHTQQGSFSSGANSVDHNHVEQFKLSSGSAGNGTFVPGTTGPGGSLAAAEGGQVTQGESQSHTHSTTISGATSGMSVNHTHTTTISGSTTANSADHTHNVTISGATVSAGSGSAFSILPLYLTAFYIMRVK